MGLSGMAREAIMGVVRQSTGVRGGRGVPQELYASHLFM